MILLLKSGVHILVALNEFYEQLFLQECSRMLSGFLKSLCKSVVYFTNSFFGAPSLLLNDGGGMPVINGSPFDGVSGREPESILVVLFRCTTTFPMSVIFIYSGQQFLPAG